MRSILRDWRFWLALAVLAVLAVWLAYQGDITCRIPRKRGQMEIIKANSCFEFWLNRYQQLIAAALAVGAAALTIRQINSQIGESKKQTAAAALDPARNSLMEFEEFLKQSRSCLRDAAQVRDAIAEYPQPDTMRGLWGGRYPEQALNQAVSLAQEIRTHVFADSTARSLADHLKQQTVTLSEYLGALEKKLVPLPAAAYHGGEVLDLPQQPDTTAEKAGAEAACSTWMQIIEDLSNSIDEIVIERRQIYLRLEQVSLGERQH